jgi:dihydrofolate synthase/folylpolyglutamate synthase
MNGQTCKVSNFRLPIRQLETETRNMQFDEALAYLLSLGHETLTIKLGLRNTETLLAALGNPERSYRSVQIAGTNGKGSTAAFLASICRVAGIHTGLFTSPHLISITERINLAGAPIIESQFARLTGEVKTVAEELVGRGELQTLPTFFEQVTAIALLAFARERVELAILETGLGGRLDSTTAAHASVVAITSIDMDHQEYLGHSLVEIAAEKAAIVQPRVTAIVAPQKREAFEVINRRCKAVGVQPRLVGPRGELPAVCSGELLRTTGDGRAVVSFTTGPAKYYAVTLALRGLHQMDNAAVAIAAAEALQEHGLDISRAAIIQGIETATHPGRLELWPGTPRFLFDGAHNPAAAKALRDYLDEFVDQPVVMIFGAMRDKALSEMMATLFPSAAKVILTTLDNPRAASIDELVAALPDGFSHSEIVRTSNVSEALRRANEISTAKGIVCVTGSLHLVGEAHRLLQKPDREGGCIPAG